MKPYCYLSILFLLTISSCIRIGNSDFSSDGSNSKFKAVSWEKMLVQAEKDHEIYGAFELSNDSIILLRRSVGIELSTDQGKTWKWLGKKIFRIDEFTVDNNGVWWGLERWKGIHEPSYCRLHKSTDLGKTWESYMFYPSVFFPYHIFSKPHQPLAVTNFGDNKVFILSGNDPRHHWQYVKQLPKSEHFADVSVGEYSVSRDNDNNKLYVKRKTGKVDTLLSFTKAYNIYKIEKASNVIYVAGPATNGIDSYFAVIKNEHLLKEFTVPGGDINLIKTQLGHIFLTSTTGAYLLQHNQLISIFK